jgi:hypothetical protein
MKKPHKMAMPKKAAKAAGGKTTTEKPKAGKHKPTGVNKPMVKESVPQVVSKTTYGSIMSRQKT